MPVVTKISPQKKRQGYYNIFIDGTYKLALSENELITFGIKPNQTVDVALVEEMVQVHINSKCYNCSLRYLAVRSRSIYEVKEYLTRRKGYDIEDVDRVTGKLADQGYLNDQAFAELWISNRLKLAQRPLSIIRLELLKKGVDKDIINSCLSSINKTQELESICQITTSRYRQTKYQDKQKLTEFLARRGYNYGLIREAFEELALFEH